MDSTSERPPVVVYVRSWCPWCRRALAILARRDISPETIDVELHPERLPEMIERASGRTTVPQIFVGAAHVGGCDDLEDLIEEGRFDSLLEGRAEA